MKKIIYVLMSLIIATGFLLGYIDIYGCSDMYQVTNKNIYIKMLNSDEYMLSSQKDRHAIEVLPYAEFDNVYVSRDNNFFSVENGKVHTLTKYELKLDDEGFGHYLDSLNLNEDIKNDIIKSTESFTSKSNVKIVFFMDNITNTLTTTTTYWNGKTFHHNQVLYQNVSPGWQTVASGSETSYALLSTLKELTINAGSFMSNGGYVIGAFSLGRTCLQTWMNATNTAPVYVHADNMIQIKVTANVYKKYTYYYEFGVNYLGAITHKAIITSVKSENTLYNGTVADTIEDSTNPYLTILTSLFNNPEEMAYLYYSPDLDPYYESVRLTMNGRPFIFTP